MALYGVGLNVNVKRIHLELRLTVSRQKGKSLRELQRIFTTMDINQNGALDAKEFEKGLNAFGFFPKLSDLQALMKFYDKNGDGQISYQEFLLAMRDPLNERRQKLVDKAFNKLDPANTGAIELNTFVENYNTNEDTDVLLKKKTRDQILDETLKNIPSAANGHVTREDFYNHYTDLSVSIPSDEGFSRLLQTTWNIKEDEESTISKEEIKGIVKNTQI